MRREIKIIEVSIISKKVGKWIKYPKRMDVSL